MEQFYYFAADGRRLGPLPLSILKRLAQGEQILPETTLEAEDGRRFRADEKLDAADFGGRTTAQEVDGASEKRKWGDAKFWLLALGVGLATICVMGATLGFASLAALFLGGVITTIILAPVLAPILAFAGCFDAKINRIDESEEETEEAERGVSRRLAEKNSEKAVEQTGDAAPSGTSDETKSVAASRRGVWLALTGAALFGVAVVSGLAASTGEADGGALVSALCGVLALICWALACGELISSLILRA